MTNIPKPKPRPYNAEFDYTVRVGEFPIKYPKGGPWTTRASHLVITGHDPNGRQLWEFNGLPTGPDNNPKDNAAGALFDSSDTIKVHRDLGEKGRYGRDVMNQRAVLWGSIDELNDYRNQLEAAGADINARNLNYRALEQNSNASVGTMLDAVGVDPRILFRHGGFKGNVPGFLLNLIHGEVD